MEEQILETTEDIELANNIPEIDNWGNIATDIIKLKMNPKYKDIELDLEAIAKSEEN